MSRFGKLNHTKSGRINNANNLNIFPNAPPAQISKPIEITKEIEPIIKIPDTEPVKIETKVEEEKKEETLTPIVQRKASFKFKLAVDQLMLNLRKEKLDHWE